jgi:hypothetical protein
MKYLRSFLLGLSVLLVSCTSAEIRMNPQLKETLRVEQEILVVHYIASPFSAYTPEVRNAGSAGMMFGAVGGAIAGAIQASEAETAGSQLVKEYHLEDPMPKIKQSFVESTRRSQSLQNLKPLTEALPSDDLDTLKVKLQGGYVLDFRTTAWSLTPSGPLSQNTYRVQYAGRARLLHLPEGTTEWQSVCETNGKIEDSAPTLLEVVADSGAFLKSQLDHAYRSCLAQFELQFTTQKP